MMPDLSDISDGEALEDFYLDRTIVYVEGRDDETAFRRIMGPAVSGALEFKAPFAGGSGCMAVVNTVRKHRPANPKVFGLVDGETAAALGCIDLLLDCDEHFFVAPPAADADGVLFLAAHELENILMLHAGFCEHVSNDVHVGGLDTISVDEIQTKLRKAARRFLSAAVLKYAASVLSRPEAPMPVVAHGRFINPQTTVLSIVLDLRREMKLAGADWMGFRTEVLRIARRLRGRFGKRGTPVDRRDEQVVRLADGKGLMKGMMHACERPQARWDGHLAVTLIGTPYGDAFRARIREFTQLAA